MNLHDMPMDLLLSNYRSLIKGAARARRDEERRNLDANADAYEAEIRKRMVR